MKIWLDKKYCMLSDKNQYILGKRYKKDRVIHIGYFPSIEGLLNNYIATLCRTKAGIKTIQDLLNCQKSLVTAVNRAVQPFKIKIIKQNEG